MITAWLLPNLSLVFTSMKLILILAIALTWLSTSAASLAADYIKVEPKLSTSHNDAKDSAEERVIKKLAVTLIGSRTMQEGTVKVVATFYADDLSANKVVVEKEVEASATLERGRAVVNLPEVTFTFTPTHGKITGTGRRAKAKRIPASGKRYHGWTVKIYNGTEIIGQAASNSVNKIQ